MTGTTAFWTGAAAIAAITLMAVLAVWLCVTLEQRSDDIER